MSTKHHPVDLSDLVVHVLRGGDGRNALDSLSKAAAKLAEQFENDPGMALNGQLFDQAEELTGLAQRLALHFSEQCQSQLAAEAWSLHLKVTLTAYPHRKNLVGPALLDYAICLENLGEHQEAQESYSRIIDDISPILSWGPTFNADWLKAVRCLQQALVRSVHSHPELATRIDSLLAQSEEMLKDHPG